ncbi:hypothetical protein KIL84_002287 [Mauremys mutica]|uniref:Uncharacterized protein n=1 Tax=Mauremys mutica TaxID=74926 RepID=A0A9D3X782_9SAUR|nr:hypothetical protein KIL84_002287 [Mauremys mutica]
MPTEAKMGFPDLFLEWSLLARVETSSAGGRVTETRRDERSAFPQGIAKLLHLPGHLSLEGFREQGESVAVGSLGVQSLFPSRDGGNCRDKQAKGANSPPCYTGATPRRGTSAT